MFNKMSSQGLQKEQVRLKVLYIQKIFSLKTTLTWPGHSGLNAYMVLLSGPMP